MREKIDPAIAAEVEWLLEEALGALHENRYDEVSRHIEQALARFREVVPGIETLITFH